MSLKYINAKIFRCKAVKLVLLGYLMFWQIGLFASILTSHETSLNKKDILSSDTQLVEAPETLSSNSFLSKGSENLKVTESNSAGKTLENDFSFLSTTEFIKNYLSSIVNKTDILIYPDICLEKISPRSPPQFLS